MVREPIIQLYLFKITRPALPWTLELLDLKHRVESISGEKFNSCLLNLYHTGDEGMSWHSDSEQQLKPHGAIASISLGAERQFVFKHKKPNKPMVQFYNMEACL